MRTQGIELLDYDGAEILMFVTSDAERSMRIRSVDKEPETLRFIQSFEPNSVFVDVGANVGAYSLIAASLGHTVIAFEPHPASFERFGVNVGLNPWEITWWPLLLWSEETTIQMDWSGDEPGVACHSVGKGKAYRTQTLDSLVKRGWVKQPDYVKVDVDGGEYEVLQGAAKTLEGVKAIQVEFDASIPGHDPKIHNFLSDLGFTQYAFWKHGVTSISNVWYRR